MRIFILTVLPVLLFSGISFGGESSQIVVEYSFESPMIQEIMIERQIYHRVVMPEAPNGGQVGQPSLPASGAQIMLPRGTRVEKIEIVTGEGVILGAGFVPEPVAPPIPLSEDSIISALPVPDPAIYESDDPFPGARFETVGSQLFRGYEILVLKLLPIEYIPSSGELHYYPNMTAIITTVERTEPIGLFRGLPQDEFEAVSRVDNIEAVATYDRSARQPADAYDLLIITHAWFADAFLPLKDYHDTTGVLTEIHTLDDIGSSDPTDIRNYIRNQYLMNGIQYVLLGGDDDLIPAVDLYVQAVSAYSGYPTFEYSMPADIYYACLDGTYNFDGDASWGEPSDGEEGGDIDLIAEVYVGRAAVDNGPDVQRFIDKTIQYVTSQHDYLSSALISGEHLGYDAGLANWGGNFMDELFDGSGACSYTTIGIPSDGYAIAQLYDRDWPGQNWPVTEMIDRINANLHLLSHLGHANQSIVLKMERSQISTLTNTQPCFIYSQGCYAGAFDIAECCAEYFTVKSTGGAFAVIMNARYGWRSFGTTDSPAHRFVREFWDAVFNPDEGKPELGRANHDSKEDNLYRINETAMRWTYYQTTLFGDPTVAIRRPHLLAFDYTGGVPATVGTDQPTPIEIAISGKFGGAVDPGSGLLHYTVDSDEETTVPLTHTGGDLYTASLPQMSCNDDTIVFRVSAEELSGDRYYHPVSGNPHVCIPAETITEILTDNFETDQGWIVSGDASAGNWERGVPYDPQDSIQGVPFVDFDGSGSCYLTGNTADISDVDGGTAIIESPAFNLQYRDAQVSYARWYSNHRRSDQPFADYMYVEISNDGGENWTAAETVGPLYECSGDWYKHRFWVSGIIQPTDQMKLRFRVGDLNTDSSIEAAIDAVSVTRYECITWACGDFNDDGKITLSDISRLIDFVYISRLPLDHYAAGNVNGSTDGKITLADITRLIDHVYVSRDPLGCL